MNEHVELTTMLTFTDRTNTTARDEANAFSYGQFNGELLRVQLQLSY